MGFLERSGGMAGFEVPGEVDNMASKEADLLEDLKLMTKRMNVRVESIEENLDTILKRSQLKRQRLLRNRKRPATRHAIYRTLFVACDDLKIRVDTKCARPEKST